MCANEMTPSKLIAFMHTIPWAPLGDIVKISIHKTVQLVSAEPYYGDKLTSGAKDLTMRDER